MPACVWACTAAAILESLVLAGSLPSVAVAAVAAELEQAHAGDGRWGVCFCLLVESHLASRLARMVPWQCRLTLLSGVALTWLGRRFAFAGSMAAEVAGHLRTVLRLAHLPPADAAAQLGRNCHLPAALQTPLHVVLHLEGRLGGARDRVRGVRAGEALAEEASVRAGCGSGQPTAAALGELYAEGVRLALQAGGCCASRASFVGACLGALGGAEAVPEGWVARHGEGARVRREAEALCAARRRM